MASSDVYQDNNGSQEINKVIVDSIGGDLVVRGDEDVTYFRAEGDIPNVNRQEDILHLVCGGDCSVVVPAVAELHVANVGGDAKITDMVGDINLNNVGGDLTIREGSKCAVGNVGGDLVVRHADSIQLGNVGGDLVVRHVEGDVHVKRVGGDFDCRDVEGAAYIGKVGGDLSLRNIEGPCTCERVEGDLILALDFNADHQYNFVVDNAVIVNLGDDPNVTFILPEEIEFESDDIPATITTENGQLFVQLGEGLAKVNIVADEFTIAESKKKRKNWAFNFDFDFEPPMPPKGPKPPKPPKGPKPPVPPMPPQFEVRIGNEKISDYVSRRISESLGKSDVEVDGENLGDFISRRVNEQMSRRGWGGGGHWGGKKKVKLEHEVEREMERAQREMERAERHGHRFAEHGERMHRRHVGQQPQVEPNEPISEQERLLVLQMLQEGKITVEQAEQLLRTMEGK